MDLFEALVRLEAAGWRTGPPDPERADAAQPPGLARALRKAGALIPPDGSPPYALAASPGPGFAEGPPMIRLRDGPDGTTWLLPLGDGLTVWRVDPEGAPILEARGLAEWLAGWVHGRPEPVDELPQGLWDLGLEGEGWGWLLDGLQAPARLAPGGLPQDLRGAGWSLDPQALWAGERLGVGPEPTGPDPTPGPAPEDGAAVDELFGEGGARPRPRVALITTLLVLGLLLTVIGMACIAAPGGLLVLLAWMHVEKDAERLESGYLPESDREAVERLRGITYAGLMVVVALFAIQGFLLCNGAYDALLDDVYLPIWRGVVLGLLGADAPPPG